MNKSNLSLAMATAALVLAAAAGGPAIARAIVPNADKVDGIDAVKSTATVKARKGKLVATSPKTGRLPNNIIATAPNAAKLGGFTPAQLRIIQLMPGAADPGSGASLSQGGALTFPDDGSTSTATWTFVIPPDYTAGKTMTADFWIAKSAASGACSVVIEARAGTGPVNGDQIVFDAKVDGVEAEKAISFPVAAGTLQIVKTRVTFSSAELKPGRFAAVQIGRAAGDGLDNCATPLLGIAGELRY